MVLANHGRAADVLEKVESPLAARVEMHSSSMAGGVMSMKQEDRVAVPAGGQVTFGPGAYHLMLIGLTRTLKRRRRRFRRPSPSPAAPSSRCAFAVSSGWAAGLTAAHDRRRTARLPDQNVTPRRPLRGAWSRHINLSKAHCMKTLWLGAAAAAALLAACPALAETEPAQPASRKAQAKKPPSRSKPAAKPAAAPPRRRRTAAGPCPRPPRMGTWGFDLAGRDTAVDAGPGLLPVRQRRPIRRAW